jgi:hypothetical protein
LANSFGAIRIAINCFGLPVAGLLTRRARLSSASVDFRISEKSIRLSGVGLAFFLARFTSTDESNRFCAILQSPQGIDYEQHSARDRQSEPLGSLLCFGMLRIFPIERIGIAEDRGHFFEGDAMLPTMKKRLLHVPREHVYVYARMGESSQFAWRPRKGGATGAFSRDPVMRIVNWRGHSEGSVE